MATISPSGIANLNLGSPFLGTLIFMLTRLLNHLAFQFFDIKFISGTHCAH
jgi:hypothetical protein